MNNRIMAALFALTLCLCLFIGVVPVEADAACSHKNKEYVSVNWDTKHIQKCKDCGATISGATELNHTMVLDASSATQHRYKCSACGYVKVEDHIADTFKSCVCTVCGQQAEHNYNVNKKDETNHWLECACGAVKEGSTEAHEMTWTANGDKHEGVCSNTKCKYKVTAKHDYTGVEWKETTSGQHYRLCTVCESDAGTKGSHVEKLVPNADGKTHSKVCETCAKVIDDNISHTLTAKDAGNGKHTEKCADCGYEATVDHSDGKSGATCVCDIDGCGAKLHVFDKWATTATMHRPMCSNLNCTERDPDAAAEKHTFKDFEYYGVVSGTDRHKAVCSVCGYKKDATTQLLECKDENKDHKCDDCGHIITMLHEYDASYMVRKPKETADCEKDIIKTNHRQCNICGQRMRLNGTDKVFLTDADVFAYAKDHDYEWEDGLASKHYQECQDCGKKVNEAPHSYSYTAGGLDQCVCVCGITHKHDITDSTSMTSVAKKGAKCTTEGKKAHYVCPECGEKRVDKDGKQVAVTDADLVIAAKGHDWLQTSATSTGLHVVQCQRANCGKTDAFAHDDTNGDCMCDVDLDGSGTLCGLAVHSHEAVRVAGKAATCAEEGFETYWKYEACGRMFADNFARTEIDAPVTIAKTACTPGAWTNEGDEHVKTCTVCGQIAEHAAHVDANSDNRCDICLFELALEYHAEIPATCTANGTKAYYESKVTHRKYWDAEGTKFIDGNSQSDLIIPKLNHIDPVTGVGPAAKDLKNGKHELKCALCDTVTKTEAHTTGGCFCAVCGAGASDKHNGQAYAYQAPVCDKDGHEAYAKCECGKYYNALGVETTYAKLVIKATGHTWGAEIFNDDSKGEHYAVCEICGKKNYGEHSLTAKDPLSGNYHQFICECGEVTLEKHYDKNGDKVCDEQGCKHDMSGEEVDVYEHKGTTVETGDKKTNPLVSWLNNWLNRTEPSTGGGSTQTQQPSNPVGPGTSSGSGSQGGSDNGGSTSGNGGGSDNGGSGNGGGSSNNQNDSSETAGLLQQLAGFLNWILTSLGF